MMDYADAQDAAKGMLLEATSLLRQSGVDAVVIGGWVPLLFHSTPIGHPGTFDVDILLNDEMLKEDVAAAALRLMSEGYMRPAKNPFQLYRVLSVAGEHTVFHIDFLHRKYIDDEQSLLIEWGPAQSIVGAGTDIIFTHNERRVADVRGILPSGEEVQHSVDFASDVGFLSAKGRSLYVEKRVRDAFDIFLVVAQSPDRERLLASCHDMMADSIFDVSMRKMHHEFDAVSALVNAAKFLCEFAPPPRPRLREALETVMATMNQLFAAVGHPLLRQKADWPD